jgi:hypothetical protein
MNAHTIGSMYIFTDGIVSNKNVEVICRILHVFLSPSLPSPLPLHPPLYVERPQINLPCLLSLYNEIHNNSGMCGGCLFV